MFNVLVIEDNFYTRKAIVETINWAELGCHLAGQASNGIDGENLALTLKPDIIITDIRMPGYDGIKLITKLKQVIQPLYVIVITGFKSFDYVHAFIKLNVTDFLLKPLDMDQLRCAIVKAVNSLNADLELASTLNEASLHIDDLSHRLLSSRETHLQVLLRNYLYDSSQEETALQSSFSSNDAECSSYGMLLFNTAVLNKADVLWNAIDASCARHITIDGENCLIFVFTDKPVSFKTRWINITETAEDTARNNQALLSYTPVVTNMQLISPYYDALQTASGNNKCGMVEPAADWDPVEAAKLIQNSGNIQDAVDKIVSSMFFHSKGIEGVRREVLKLLEAYEEIARGRLFVPQNLSSAGDILSTLQSLHTGKEVRDFLLKNYSFSPFSQDFSNCSPMVRSVYHYLCSHYMEDISLSGLSEIFFLSPNYLSSLIKRETGKSFTDILNGIRIEKAKSLLKDPRLQINQLGKMVGYNEYAYFFQVFKKYTGLSPKEYRKKAGDNDET